MAKAVTSVRQWSQCYSWHHVESPSENGSSATWWSIHICTNKHWIITIFSCACVVGLIDILSRWSLVNSEFWRRILFLAKTWRISLYDSWLLSKSSIISDSKTLTSTWFVAFQFTTTLTNLDLNTIFWMRHLKDIIH